jgi:lipopolysaccharide/colanic/teichoic acid biosynthesis glycosyltransferase
MHRIFAIVFLIIFFPVFILLYLIVKLTSKGPFIFKQSRVGKGFEDFTIYKIRTMVEGAETKKKEIMHLNEIDGPVFKINDDPRFTVAGKILSRTGIDELPQLVNILKGDMSFVGPRPLPIEEAVQIPDKYRERFKVKPGITSTWIIYGAHGLTFNEWMRLDVKYVKEKSALFDLNILFKTVFLMIKWFFAK